MSRVFDLHFSNMAWAAIVASPVIGSFLGVVIERLPEGRQFVWGRSQCDACGQTLGALDLIPVASWLSTHGRCRYCGAKLSAFYPLIEIAAWLVAVWSATATTGVLLVASCLIGWLLLVVVIINQRNKRSFAVPLLAALGWIAWLYALPRVI